MRGIHHEKRTETDEEYTRSLLRLGPLRSVVARRIRNYGKICVAVERTTMFLRAARFLAMLITLLLLAAPVRHSGHICHVSVEVTR